MQLSPPILIKFFIRDLYGITQIVDIRDIRKIDALLAQITEGYFSKNTIIMEIAYFLIV